MQDTSKKLRFTNKRYAKDVKSGDLFVRKQVLDLVVCQRTPRGYRNLFSLSGGEIYLHVRPKVEPLEGLSGQLLVKRAALMHQAWLQMEDQYTLRMFRQHMKDNDVRAIVRSQAKVI